MITTGGAGEGQRLSSVDVLLIVLLVLSFAFCIPTLVHGVRRTVFFLSKIPHIILACVRDSISCMVCKIIYDISNFVTEC